MNLPLLGDALPHRWHGRGELRPTRAIFDLKYLIAFGSLIAFLVTYAIFRTQNQMEAIKYLSDNSGSLSDKEFEDDRPFICVYEWGAATVGKVREKCGDNIFFSGAQFSASFDEIQLYIEEVLLYFIESQRVARLYEARMYGGLNYWPVDLSRDPTGAVSYYVVSREQERHAIDQSTPESIACLALLSRVPIERTCDKFNRLAVRSKGLIPPIKGHQCVLLNAPRPAVTEADCEDSWWNTKFAGEP